MSVERLSGWGRYLRADCPVGEPRDWDEAARLYRKSETLIARGNGRSYGDAALNSDGVLSTRRLNHMLDFDEDTGVLVCEAGVLLDDIIAVFLPRGWFPVVTPGTRFVTVGGMIGSDVHGKNHHRHGSFCDHVLWLDLMLPDGEIVHCSPDHAPDLFAATCGGMGLTGTIQAAAFTLQRVETGYMRQHTMHAATLEETFAILDRTLDATYTVAWIDGLASGSHLGRSVVFLGEHLPAREMASATDGLRVTPPRSKSVPLDFPRLALSRYPVKLFNAVYRRAQRPGERIASAYSYFYPLDAVLEWNRIYGRRGFFQYQCVLPLASSAAGMRRLLQEIASRGEASFLSVLKRMGPQSFGFLSFPMEGYTLAMDFAATPGNLELVERLDAIVAEHGGRIYLAKDAISSPEVIRAGYPSLARFQETRRRYGLDGRVASALSHRIGL